MRILVFLHVLAAAAWLGAALWVAGDVRRTLALGRPLADSLAARVAPALRLDLLAGGATLATGLALLALEGPPAARPGILAGLGLTLARLGLTSLLALPAWRRVEAAIAAGDLGAAAGPSKRLAMLGGVGHALWLGALAGMIFG